MVRIEGDNEISEGTGREAPIPPKDGLVVVVVVMAVPPSTKPRQEGVHGLSFPAAIAFAAWD